MEVLAPESIGIIMLAAGQSNRFRGDKRLAMLPSGKTLLESSLARVPASLEKRILVLHPGDDYLASKFRDQWQIVIADNATRGMGISLAAGITQASGWAGALIALGDMPFIQPDTYTLVQQSLCRLPIIVPSFEGQRGHPAGFRQAYFQDMSQLDGDQGAQGIIRKYQQDCVFIDCDDMGIVQDVDTRDALLGMQEPPENP